MSVDGGIRAAALGVLTLALLSSPVAAQRPSTKGTATQMVVTVVAKQKNTELPTLSREDVFVFEGQDRDRILDWTPLQSKDSALQLFIVIDEGLNSWFARQVDDLQDFVSKLPPSAAVGVGYMTSGAVTIVQELTTDHARAIKALRLPSGAIGTPASPYLVLSDLISRWPNGPVRRELLLVSDGIDGLFPGGSKQKPYVEHPVKIPNPHWLAPPPKTIGNADLFRDGSNQNLYVDQAARAAQKSGVIVHCMFAHGSGYNFSPEARAHMTWGQQYESQLSHATGGEFYYLDFGTGPSITPYLDDLSNRLAHQYLLTFVPARHTMAGFRSVRLKTRVPNAVLVAPEKVYVPAPK